MFEPGRVVELKEHATDAGLTPVRRENFIHETKPKGGIYHGSHTIQK